MARNVRFIKTTKEKWLKRDSYDPLALYFCEDTQEMCKGDQVLTDGIRIVPTKADLPTLPFAADGVIYYIAATKSGYMMSPDRTEWLQTIYAPVEDATTIPEDEVYNTVTTVGAVRDIENAIYTYIDQEIANVEISGSAGKDGLSAYEVWLNDGHTGTESDFLNWLKGKDGQNGSNGEDGKTPYIQGGYWYIDGTNTGVKAEGVDGRNGVNGSNGVDGKTPYIQSGYWYIDGKSTNVKAEGKDGLNGKDGASGKDGKSAYEIWLEAGHNGSEDDFLQWLKGDNDPFGDVVTSIDYNGIAAGTSLKGKTVKDVLVMLLGIQDAPKSAVEQIIDGRIPAYSGTANLGDEEVTYADIDVDMAAYTDVGFYVVRDDNGNINKAGYQIAFEGNTDMDAQTFAILSNAKIISAYQYDEFGTQTWLQYEFPGSYWVEGDMKTETVNGQTVTYQTYYYDVDNVGDAITTSEYWRFEIEV